MATNERTTSPGTFSDGLVAGIVTEARYVVGDSVVMAWRNLLKYRRSPELLLFSTVSPVMFVLLFVYVFGGAISTGPISYTDFILVGILVQTTLFGSTQTGIGLAEDLQKGMVDRYRSMPMARSAVLAGRILADTIRNVFVVYLMIGVGMAIGFRFHGGFWPGFWVPFLVVGFGIAFSWVAAVIGASVRNVETANSVGFVYIFPLTFMSSAFVPVETMPDWLRPIAEHNPITRAVDAGRAMAQGGPLVDDVLLTMPWIAGITLVCAPWAIWQYRRVS